MFDMGQGLQTKLAVVIGIGMVVLVGAVWGALALMGGGGALVVAIVMMIVVGAGLHVLLSTMLISPVKELVGSIEYMASGDFSHPIDIRGGDEMVRVGQNLENMRQELVGMIAGMMTTSEALKQSAEKLKQSVSVINGGTGRSGDASAQVASAVTEMTATVNEVANNAALAAESTQEANRGASEGLSIMDTAIQSISAVAEDVASISVDMSKLEQDTTSVGAVLDVIKGIAEQTNLLALNAAIEAARAGEQGRGFAVVADEVRALAQRTQESTAEIHHIIETVQNGAAAAATAMQAGTDRTREAVEFAEKAGASIRSIADAISKVEGMNTQIAAAAEEQSVAAEEINSQVVNMSDITSRTFDSVNQTSGVADGLDQTAKDLSSMVIRFKI